MLAVSANVFVSFCSQLQDFTGNLVMQKPL